MGRLAAVAFACLLPTLALADDPKKWHDAAKQLVQKGDAATRGKRGDEAKTHYNNAVIAYEKAIEAGADVNLFFELASFEEKIGRPDRAATHFRALVKAQGARADLVKKAQARFDDLTSKLGLLTIVARPEGTVISIGGEEVARTPLADPLVLAPGEYTLVLAAEGHQPKEVVVKVDAGSESERTIELEAAKVVVQPVEPPPPKDEPEPVKPVTTSRPSKTPLYAGLGATGGLVLIATVTGIVALGKESTFEDENASPSDREAAKDSGKRFALVTDLCLVGALAAGGFTAYWYFAKYRPAQRKSGELSAKAQLTPWVKPDAGGLALAGSF